MNALPALFFVLTALPQQTLKPATPQEIEQAVQKLGDASFQEREQASKYLWEQGHAAEAALAKASKSADLETAKRARKILDKFKLGLYPDTPKEIVELIKEFRQATDDNKAGVAGKFLALKGPGYRNLGRLLAEEPKSWDQIQDVIAATKTKLVVDGSFDELEEFLEMTALGGHPLGPYWYATLLHLRNRSAQTLPRLRGLAESGQYSNAWLALAYVHRNLDQQDKVIQSLEKVKKPKLVMSLLQEAKAWKILSGKFDDLNVEEPMPDFDFGDDPKRPGLKAAYHRLAGNVKEFDKIAGELESIPGSTQLLLNGEVQRALDVYAKSLNVRWLDLWSARLQYKEMFKLAEELPPEAGGGDFSEYLSFLARKFNSLGDNAKRDEFLDKLQKNTVNDHSVSMQFLELCREINQRARAVKVAIRLCEMQGVSFPLQDDRKAEGRQGAQGDLGRQILKAVYGDTHDDEMIQWSGVVQKKLGKGKYVELFEQLDLILGRKAADKAAMQAWLEYAETVLPTHHPREFVVALSRTAKHWGLADWQEKILVQKLERGPEERVNLELGRLYLSQKKTEKALETLKKARQLNVDAPATYFFEALAHEQKGDQTTGAKCRLQASLFAMDSWILHQQFAETLEDAELFKDAIAQYRLIARRGDVSTVADGFSVTDVFRRLAYMAAKHGEYAVAADAMEQMMLKVLGTPNLTYRRMEAYLWVPSNVHVWRARALAEKGKLDEALKEVQLSQVLLPGDSRGVIYLTPFFEAKGRLKDLDAVFHGPAKAHKDVLDEYPDSPLYHNNYAWLLVRCNRELPAAVKHARRSVELAPKQAGHMDTLAEALFQTGEQAEAVRIMTECTQIEPENLYFRTQLARMKKGDPKVPVGEE